MKRCSFLILREIQIKATMKYYICENRYYSKDKNKSVGEDVGEEISYTVYDSYSHDGKQYRDAWENKK